MSNSVQPHRWQPTTLPHLWDSPGRNTGVGCHFLLQCMKVKRESVAAQSCPTLSDPMDCSLRSSSHGIFQASVLEWVAIAFSTVLNSATEDEMAGWHHWLDGHESEWTPGVGDGHGGLACCDSWGLKESDTIERLNWTEKAYSTSSQ